MRVMVMIRATTKVFDVGRATSEEMPARIRELEVKLVNAGVMLAGGRLRPSRAGKSIRIVGDQRTVVDGSVADPKELFAGFWIWQVRSMDEALEWVRRYPDPPPGVETTIEVRPIVEERE